MSKRRGAAVPLSASREQLRRSYGSLSEPKRHFVLSAANRRPFEDVLAELSRSYPVDDDTDINCDVCFTFIVRGEQPLIVKLSMVGPYAVVLSFGADGLGRGSLVGEPGDADGFAGRVVSAVESHGFFRPSADQLETPVPIALVPGRAEVPLYAALFEPEGEAPWR